jgi:SAM-dependent methyltransferase
MLPKGARILDAGCGPGHHAQHLSQQGFDVLGIDLSSSMLRIARRKVLNVEFRLMDARDLRLGVATVDAVWCAAMALHVPREEVLSMLRCFRSVLGINVQVGRLSEVVYRGEDHRFFEYYHDGEALAQIVRRAGFDIAAEDYGETNRNTHALELTLRWVTLYARPSFDDITPDASDYH